CKILADFATGRMVQFCVEHCPGRALSSAAATLDFLDQLGNQNVGLLLDVGHCLITQERAASIIERAGSRLGYIHLDDNDGKSDLHWPLLTGCLTEAILRETLAAVMARDYKGALTLELASDSPAPGEALQKGKQLLDKLLRELVPGQWS